MTKRTLKEYVFEKTDRETIIADTEKDAREKLGEWYGNDHDFELVNVTTFEESK